MDPAQFEKVMMYVIGVPTVGIILVVLGIFGVIGYRYISDKADEAERE